MRVRMRGRLNYANVMSTIAVFLFLSSGVVYAAGQLGKNSVGSKQLKKNAVTAKKIKKNAVTTAKIKKQAVTAAKVKNGTLTGKQINASTLGTVPSAQTANSLAPGEGWHEIGAAGEPGFENGWKNAPPGPGFSFEGAGFYKDHEGIVHLKGFVLGGSGIIFHLPPGYRPASGRVLSRLTICGGGTCTSPVGVMLIAGPNIPLPNADGEVVAPGGSALTLLEGISFRAES